MNLDFSGLGKMLNMVMAREGIFWKKRILQRIDLDEVRTLVYHFSKCFDISSKTRLAVGKASFQTSSHSFEHSFLPVPYDGLAQPLF